MVLARLYAELLMKVLSGKEGRELNRRIDHFVVLLKSRGHEQLLPRVIREFEKVVERARRRGDVVLSVARREDSGAFIAEANKVLKNVGRTGATLREKIDESLVRGFSLEGGDFRYDASARRKLLALYETLTA